MLTVWNKCSNMGIMDGLLPPSKASESDTAVRTEHYDYRPTCRPRNEGCDLFPSCLRCPLPQCRYDNPGRQTGKELRNREMVRLRKAGMEVKELAQRFGVSKRTVHRIIAPSKTSESDLRRTSHNGECPDMIGAKGSRGIRHE